MKPKVAAAREKAGSGFSPAAKGPLIALRY